jgi:deoxycytidylate deaminase
MHDNEVKIVSEMILMSLKSTSRSRRVCAHIVADGKKYFGINHNEKSVICDTIVYECVCGGCSYDEVICNKCGAFMKPNEVTFTSTVHAEIDLFGTLPLEAKPKYGTLYITDAPCYNCSLEILKRDNIKRVVYVRDFTNTRGLENLNGRVTVEKFNTDLLKDEIRKYIV